MNDNALRTISNVIGHLRNVQETNGSTNIQMYLYTEKKDNYKHIRVFCKIHSSRPITKSFLIFGHILVLKVSQKFLNLAS